MGKRRYSDSDRATTLAALDANGGDLSRTARDTGVPRQTIQEWASGRVPADVPEIRQGQRGSLADHLDALAWKLADAIPDKVPDATLSQAAVAMGICIDKARLLRGLNPPGPDVTVVVVSGIDLGSVAGERPGLLHVSGNGQPH